MTRPAGAPPPGPALEVTSGSATAEEIAALTVVLAAAAAGHQAAVPAPRLARAPGWADRSRLMSGPLAHGPGGWRASARPR
jgi:acyl-CoA carboxylase epsilon subunit